MGGALLVLLMQLIHETVQNKCFCARMDLPLQKTKGLFTAKIQQLNKYLMIDSSNDDATLLYHATFIFGSITLKMLKLSVLRGYGHNITVKIQAVIDLRCI
jgi:hypothetical protein